MVEIEPEILIWVYWPRALQLRHTREEASVKVEAVMELAGEFDINRVLKQDTNYFFN